MVGSFRLQTVPYLPAKNLPNRENRLFVSSHSCHPPLWGRRYNLMGWGRGLSVSEVNLTPEPGRRAQHEFRFTSMETIFKYT